MTVCRWGGGIYERKCMGRLTIAVMMVAEVNTQVIEARRKGEGTNQRAWGQADRLGGASGEVAVTIGCA